MGRNSISNEPESNVVWQHESLVCFVSKTNHFSFVDEGGDGGRNFNNFGGAADQQQDTVFVSGLPEDVTDDQIAEFFGSIGIIKIDKKTSRPKIWIYRDKMTGRGKGEATVTYDDPPTAGSAIQWFNGKINWLRKYFVLIYFILNRKRI